MNHWYRLIGLIVLGAQLSCVVGVSAAPTPSDESLFHEGAPPVSVAMTHDGVPSFSGMVKELSPAVVNISVEGGEVAKEEKDELPNPFFKHDPRTPFRSLGSGIVLDEDGHIATNGHVVGKAKKIIVRFLNDKKEYTAKLIGIDEKTDLALIKVSAGKPLKYAFLGDSDQIEVGDWVVAIGNQFQLGQTVTAGIVSATSRRVPTGSPYDAFIQTDASINPGSSGGPLFNIKGQVVGINTAIFSPGRAQFGGSGFNIGIGFAIPVNLAKKIYYQLHKSGKVTRGMLGVMIQRIDADTAEALNLKSVSGALVSDIVAGSPAAGAGFKRRDVIVSFDGHPVEDHDQLPLMVASTAVNTKVSVGILRDGKEQELKVTIAELQDQAKENDTTVEKAEKPDEIGLRVAELTAALLQALKLPSDTTGVLVETIEPGSLAESTGFQRGDIVLEIDGKSIKNRASYLEMLGSVLASDKPVLVLLRRTEGTRFLTLKKN